MGPEVAVGPEVAILCDPLVRTIDTTRAAHTLSLRTSPARGTSFDRCRPCHVGPFSLKADLGARNVLNIPAEAFYSVLRHSLSMVGFLHIVHRSF